MFELKKGTGRQGRTAVILIVCVLLLFAVWLVLKTSQDSGSTSKPSPEKHQSKSESRQDVASEEKTSANEKEQSSRKKESGESEKQTETEKGSEKTSDRTVSGNDQPETSGDQSDSLKTKEENTAEEDSSAAASETTNSGSSDQEKGTETENEIKQKEVASTEENKEAEQQEKKVAIKTDEKVKGKDNQSVEDEQKSTDEEGTREEKQEEKNKLVVMAEKSYEQKKYEQAMQRLDRAIEEVESEEKKEKLLSRRSAWKEEFNQRRKLAQSWLKKARTAAENSDWKNVISHAKRALEHVPELSKAKSLIKKAEKKKKYQNMVKIPGGTYPVADYSGQTDATERTISAFYIDRHEVTNADYKAFMEETDHEAPIGWSEREIPEGKGNHPVTGIKFSDAEAYAAWAGKRLPEAYEWEAAARGKGGRKFPWGNSKTVESGTVPANTAEAGHSGTVPVDTYDNGCTPKNVCHMLGNVAEWTKTSVKYTKNETYHFVKGGSFLYPIKKGLPERQLLRDPRTNLIGIGFRCVKDPE